MTFSIVARSDDGESWGACWLGTTDAEGKAVESVSLAVAMATRDGGAELVTAPTFGCVQWAARDP